MRSKLQERLSIGRTQLLNEPIQDEADYRHVSTDLAKWRKYNVDLLQQLFSGEEASTEFNKQIHFVYSGAPQPLGAMVQSLHQDIEIYLQRLESLLERTELFTEDPSVMPPTNSTTSGDAVFIVHGHGRFEHEVARVVDDAGAEPIILQEQIHGGSATLIEKLEREAQKCGYAIVIYTGDDVGKAQNSAGELTLRARENVVLELGYFIGKLGRDLVTVLHDPKVQFPSDFMGVGYYPLDEGGAWKVQIQRELRRAGVSS